MDLTSNRKTRRQYISLPPQVEMMDRIFQGLCLGQDQGQEETNLERVHLWRTIVSERKWVSVSFCLRLGVLTMRHAGA